MLPSSWKSEIQKTVEETTNSSDAERKARETEQSAAIASQLAALVNQLKGEEERVEQPKQIKKWTDAITLGFVFLTVIFTGLSWCAFRDQLGVFKEQLGEMQRVYGPIKEQADAAKGAMIATSRAWLAPRVATFAKELGLHQPWDITVAYGNVGKEPGLGFVAHEEFGSVAAPKPAKSWYSVFSKDTLKDVCTGTIASDNGLTIYPSGPIDHRYNVSADLRTFDVTQDILDGTRIMFIHGCFAYRTVGSPHKSEYCFLFVPVGDIQNNSDLQVY